MPYSDVRPEDLIPPAPGSYRVQPGDVLALRIRDIVGPGIENVKMLRVSGSGKISLPLLGTVHVADLTEADINELLRRAYQKVCF